MKPIDCLWMIAAAPTQKNRLRARKHQPLRSKLNTYAATQRYRPQAWYRCNKNYGTVKHCEIEKHGCEKAVKLFRSPE